MIRCDESSPASFMRSSEFWRSMTPAFALVRAISWLSSSRVTLRNTIPASRTPMQPTQSRPRRSQSRRPLARFSAKRSRALVAGGRGAWTGCGPGGRECPVERLELVVHGDANRLEHPLGGVPAGEARRGRQRRLDRLDQLMGRLDRGLRPSPRDRARDLARVALLAVCAEEL